MMALFVLLTYVAPVGYTLTRYAKQTTREHIVWRTTYSKPEIGEL